MVGWLNDAYTARTVEDALDILADVDAVLRWNSPYAVDDLARAFGQCAFLIRTTAELVTEAGSDALKTVIDDKVRAGVGDFICCLLIDSVLIEPAQPAAEEAVQHE